MFLKLRTFLRRVDRHSHAYKKTHQTLKMKALGFFFQMSEYVKLLEPLYNTLEDQNLRGFSFQLSVSVRVKSNIHSEIIHTEI
jgi:hypothetical protein